ncbi:flavodoxin [Schaedlerella arabinosiphila]|uniref:flavodoxin n=1 Tax=Schaedlerella arabinosiphila TaxID=2044587 RepID=UPI0025583585|nr:flavodoxin [Schaedlerella arabinosiphila]
MKNQENSMMLSVKVKSKSKHPLLQGNVPVAEHGTIFLGFLIWWYTAPMVIRTYLETYDFTGKKIVLFATSSGSGLGRTAEELADSCPGADESHYKTLVQYLNLDDQGIVLGYGCGTVSMTRHSEYLNKAYRFGQGL